MSQTRVLISGAGGFIGQHLVRHQLERGRRVRALDWNAAGLEHIGPREKLEVMVGDIADLTTQRKAVAGVDLVFHLASAHLETGLSDSAYYRTNVAAVETLLEKSLRAGVRRFVHVSSSSVHGSVQNPPANEEAPFQPDIAYERTKLAGELAARDFNSQYGFSVVVVRPTWVYGPGCKRTARLFRMIADGKFVMVGQGTNLRSAVYIADLLEALELCAACQGIDGEVFIVTHDELVTVGVLVDSVARMVGVPSPRVRLPIWLARGTAALIEVSARGLGKQPPISRRSRSACPNAASRSATTRPDPSSRTCSPKRSTAV